MKQKRYRKLLISIGKSRNAAERLISAKPDGVAYKDLWNVDMIYNKETLSKEKMQILDFDPELLALCMFICFGDCELNEWPDGIEAFHI